MADNIKLSEKSIHEVNSVCNRQISRAALQIGALCRLKRQACSPPTAFLRDVEIICNYSKLNFAGNGACRTDLRQVNPAEEQTQNSE